MHGAKMSESLKLRDVARTSLAGLLTVLAVAASSAFGADGAIDYQIKPPTDGQAAEYKLDPAFYKKCTQVQGILIATSARVSDYAHREAAYQFDMVMKCLDPNVARRIRDRKVLCILIAASELTSDLPQFHSD